MMVEAGAARLRAWRLVIAAGIAIGIAYALSPLTVLFVIAMVLTVRRAVSGLHGEERRWVLIALIAAVVLRVAAVAALFVATNHAQVPFGSFFGDEEYFIKRSIWLRNVGFGIPIHAADLIYAFDEYSATSYLYVLAFVQALVGTAPYGVHLLGIGFYMCGAVLLYRLIRTSFGRMPAFIGLGLLMFLPSLFAWSISALKDPLFTLISALSLVAAVTLTRARLWSRRVAAAVAIVAIAAILGTVRQAGGLLTIASIATGLMLAAVAMRPWLLLASMIVLPIGGGLVLSRPAVQLKAYAAVQAAAGQHWGHVATPGWVYQLLDARFYPDRLTLLDMRFDEAARFLVRAIGRYVTVPLPWEAQSTAALAYLPEQLVWYFIAALAPIGLVFALRRDAVVAGLLFGYAIIAALLIAVTSGNVGTLVRHRGLALPYIVWLSAVGGCELLSLVHRRRQHGPAATGASASLLMRIESTWR